MPVFLVRRRKKEADPPFEGVTWAAHLLICLSIVVFRPLLAFTQLRPNVPTDRTSDLPSAVPPPLAALPASTAAPDRLQLLADRVASRLRGLVGSIDGYTDLLAETLRTEEQRELSLRILEGTTHIERLADQLVRYSAPVRPAVRSIRLSALIERLRHAMGADGWERVVVQRSATTSADMMADPALLQQALGALIHNALDASAKQPIHLSLSADATSHTVRFDVWNAGAIADNHLPDRVFAPFFTTKPGRLGMGLSLARRIAEAHGGAVHLVHSTAEAGTRFAMTLSSRPFAQVGPDSSRPDDLNE